MLIYTVFCSFWYSCNAAVPMVHSTGNRADSTIRLLWMAPWIWSYRIRRHSSRCHVHAVEIPPPSRCVPNLKLKWAHRRYRPAPFTRKVAPINCSAHSKQIWPLYWPCSPALSAWKFSHCSYRCVYAVPLAIETITINLKRCTISTHDHIFISVFYLTCGFDSFLFCTSLAFPVRQSPQDEFLHQHSATWECCEARKYAHTYIIYIERHHIHTHA